MAENHFTGEAVEIEGLKLYKFNVLGHIFYWNTPTIAAVTDSTGNNDIRVYVRVGSVFVEQIQQQEGGIKAVHSSRGMRNDYANLRKIDAQKPLINPAVAAAKATALTPVPAVADTTILATMHAEWKELEEGIGANPDKTTTFALIDKFHSGNVAMSNFLKDMYSAKYHEVKKNKYA